jgi:hypothetical protein
MQFSRCMALVSGLLAACAGSDISGPQSDAGTKPTDPPPPVTGVDAGTPPVNRPFVPGTALMPRLTAAQYQNSIEAIFGAYLPSPGLELDQNPYLFYSIGAASTTLSEVGTQQYHDAAIEIADALVSDTTRMISLLGCTPARVTDVCAQDFIRNIGRQLYRRPLSEFEFERWYDLARSGSARRSVYLRLRDVLAGMLQSPYFLYRIERGQVDPDDSTRLRYTAYEMASRISFVFWNETPDMTLLAAAESGSLLTDEGIRAQAERLLAAPKARKAVQDFFAQYLDLNRLNEVDRDPADYPGFTETMPQSMRKELELIVDDVVFRKDADIRKLFDTRQSFVNEELANLYGIEVEGASPIAYAPVTFPADSNRVGILTLGAFLTMNAHPSETSPTLRGKYVRERVLCQTVPVPPDNVDLNLSDPPNTMPRTLRERLEEHRENPACASCHSFIDPPGFLFENYDSVGRFRTHEGEYLIDASGSLDGQEMTDARELGPLLRNDPRVALCLVRQTYRHAMGRLDLPSEWAPLRDLIAAFERGEYRFKTLLIELVLSDGFRKVAPEMSE